MAPENRSIKLTDKIRVHTCVYVGIFLTLLFCFLRCICVLHHLFIKRNTANRIKEVVHIC